MRLVAMSALFFAVTQSFSAYGQDSAKFKLSLDLVKVGYGNQSSEPVDAPSSSNKFYYVDVVGTTAETNSTPDLELGFQYGDLVVYAYPLGSFGERELWLGTQVNESFEWGLVAGGFMKTYQTPVTTTNGQKIQSDAFNKFGLFANTTFKVFELDLATSLVPYVGLARSKFEQSTANEESTSTGLSGEVLYSHELAKNLALGLGVSFDWNKTKKKINGQAIQTDTSLDFAFHPARLFVQL